MTTALLLGLLFGRIEMSAIERINQYRQSQGLPALQISIAACELAREHSAAMARGKFNLGHDGFMERVQALRQSIPIVSAGENTEKNFGWEDPSKRAVETWITSEKHLKNINGNFHLTGIGIAVSAKGEFYFTQLFLRRR